MVSAGDKAGQPAKTKANDIPTAQPRGAGDILAISFGATVAMWGLGYICRLPLVMLPSQIVLAVMLLCLFGGGVAAGRYTQRGLRGGLVVGLLSNTLNLLILGSLLTGDQPNQMIPSALWYIPGSYVIAAILGVAGAWAGAFWPYQGRPVMWTCVFAWVACAGTLLLVFAGGLVTSYEAGMAVLDWPNSFGYNMFLYPLSRMTGGIYLEHAHRLVGSLIGLTTVVLAVHIWIADSRRWLRYLAVAAVPFVIIQGLLGGFRVTEDNLVLAAIHGVLGQCFFALLIALAVFTSYSWSSAVPAPRMPPRTTDFWLSGALAPLMLLQLVLGAIQRHLSQGLHIHIAFAVIVLFWAVAVGARAWGLYLNQPILQRAGLTLCSLTGFQLCLGIAALIVVGVKEPGEGINATEALVATAHQTVGAFLLAVSVFTAIWVHREQRPLTEPAP